MKFILLLLVPMFAFAQNIPSDQVKIGRPQTASDKELIFDTNDGANNKKLSVEKTSKKLKWNGNSVEIGDGALLEDKSIIFNGTSGKGLKYDFTNTEFNLNDDLNVTGSNLKIGGSTNLIRVNGGDLEFSNDGVQFKKIGSGSGGGESNILLNNSFEDSLYDAEWTFTGTSTKDEELSVVLDGLKSFKVTSSAQSFRLEQKATTNAAQLAGLNGNASIYVLNGQAGDQVCAIVDDVDVNCVDVAESSEWKQYVVSFVFGATNNGIVLKSSSRTGVLYADNAKVVLGTTQKVAQARMVGKASFGSTALCDWSTNASSYTNFAANANCSFPNYLEGDVSSSLTKTPSFRLSGGAGKYVVYSKGLFVTARVTNSTACDFALSDGTTKSGTEWVGDTASGNLTGSNIVSEFNYDSSFTNKEFTLQARRFLGDGNCVVGLSASGQQLEFSVYYYPPSQEIFSADSLGWFVDVNIGGANPSLGTSNVTSYTEITNSSLNLVVNASKGSQPAKILCSGTNPPTGDVCSVGNESIGISVNIPEEGPYEICAGFSVAPVASVASSAIRIPFQLVETPINGQNILQEGQDRVQAGFGVTSTSTGELTTRVPVRTCSIFKFSSAGEKAVRLMYEMSVAGTVLENIIVADRLASEGQRDIHFTVKPAINLERINGSFAQIEDSLKTIPNQNYVINGNFDFWQRGVSLGAGTGLRRLADRFDTNAVISTIAPIRQTFATGQPDVPNNPIYFHRSVVASSAGANNYALNAHKLEDVTKLAGKTVTLSFWAKADTTRQIGIEFQQVFGTGGSPSANVDGIGTSTATLTTSWQKITRTVAIPSVAGKTVGTNLNSYLQFIFWFDCGSTFSSRCGNIGQQSGTFDIAQMKVEEGLNATPFVLAGGTLAGEFSACQRFYEKTFNFDVAPASGAGTAGAISLNTSSAAANANNTTWFFSTPKRATPSMTFFNPLAAGSDWRNVNDNVNVASGTDGVGTKGVVINMVGAPNDGRRHLIHATADAEL